MQMQFPDINKLCNVASCWIYSGMYQLPNLHFSLPTKINVVCKPILVHHYFFLITSFFCFCENYYYDTSNEIFNINLCQCNMQGSHRWSVLSRDRSLFNILRTFIKNTEQCFIHYQTRYVTVGYAVNMTGKMVPKLKFQAKYRAKNYLQKKRCFEQHSAVQDCVDGL